jgi:hypothetical protein
MALLLLASAHMASSQPGILNMSWSDGFFSFVGGGAAINIGNTASALNVAVAGAFNATSRVVRPRASAFTLLNASTGALSYLYLHGNVSVDEPLAVRAQMVVVLLDAVLQAAPGASVRGRARKCLGVGLVFY